MPHCKDCGGIFPSHGPGAPENIRIAMNETDRLCHSCKEKENIIEIHRKICERHNELVIANAVLEAANAALREKLEIWQEWELLKEVCQFAGVRLEFIPIDPKPYHVTVIYTCGALSNFERSESELVAIRQAVQCFKEVNAKMSQPASQGSPGEGSGPAGMEGK